MVAAQTAVLVAVVVRGSSRVLTCLQSQGVEVVPSSVIIILANVVAVLPQEALVPRPNIKYNPNAKVAQLRGPGCLLLYRDMEALPVGEEVELGWCPSY